jgi:hypothetical protein
MKIISFSLFGNTPLYCQGAVENARLARDIYPDWIARFYIANDVPRKYIKQIKLYGAQVVMRERKNTYDALHWRFRPLMEGDVEAWISRDCDSRLNWRERAAVEEWLQSDKSLHVMRDAHNHTYPIMAGMFGINNTLFHARYGKINLTEPSLNLDFVKHAGLKIITDYNTFKIYVRLLLNAFLKNENSDTREGDQNLLQQTVWNIAINDHLCHDHWNNNAPVGQPTMRLGDTISPDKAFGVGLIKYVTTRSLKPSGSYPPGQDSRPFPLHEPIEYGLYVGQTIDGNNNVKMDMATRWEYELRGIPLHHS